MFRTLAQFAEALENEGELKRITTPTSPICEIAAAAQAQSRLAAPTLPHPSTCSTDPAYCHLGGRALLYTQVHNASMPLLINAFGSYHRMELALNCADSGLASIAERIAQLVKPAPPRSFHDAMAMLSRFAPLLRIGPKHIDNAICQQVVHLGDDIDLRTLPLIRCWPHDGHPEALGYPAGINAHIPGSLHDDDWEANHRGKYITLAGIHTIHADDADHQKPPSHNIGMYRVQLLGPRLMVLHMQLHHDGAAHLRSWKKLGKPMPVAIAFGGPSVLPYAATCPLPPGVSELLMAGFLQGEPIRMVRCKTVPLSVPADSEIIIEGFVSTNAGHPGWDPVFGEPLGLGAAFEGPFGDHTGFYSLPDRYPLLHVTALTHRHHPILPATVVGMPPQEDYFLGKATERIMHPLLKTVIPDLIDYDLPLFGAFHNAACVKITKHYPLHARRMMHSVWGAGQMSWTKNIFIVEDDIDVHDARAVLCAMARHCDPRRDIELTRGPLDVLDHASPYLGAGAKLGFDCTRKWPAEAIGPYNVNHELSAGHLDSPAQARSGDGGILKDQQVSDETVSSFVRAASEAGQVFCETLTDIPGVLDAHLPEDLPGLFFVSVDKKQGQTNKPGLAQQVIEHIKTITQQQSWSACRPPAYIIVLGAQVDIADTDQALFHFCANFDASRDLVIWSVPFDAETDLHDPIEHAFRSWGVAAFDAAPKAPGDERHNEPVRPWPPVLTYEQSHRHIDGH